MHVRPSRAKGDGAGGTVDGLCGSSARLKDDAGALLMYRFAVVCSVCCLPVLALAGGNPFIQGAPPPSQAPRIKKLENVFEKDGRELPPCDAAGRDPKGGTECKPPEPVLLPRDGVTDDMLEKYRLKK
jgi:hypothetical protein